jgi:hypothetical protein
MVEALRQQLRSRTERQDLPMHDDPIPGRTGDAPRRGAEDAVFRRVLDLHPAYLNERELALDLVGATLAPKCETYEVAIQSLVADGLLRREGDSIQPTRAALRAEAVER